VSIIFNIYKYEYKYSSDSKNIKYKVMIIEKQKEDENKISYLAKLNNDKFILNIYIKNKYDSKKNFSKEKVEEIKQYKYGDIVNVDGKITIPEMLGNIGEFNYKKYLNSKDICGIVNAYDVDYVNNTGKKVIKQIYNLKQKISDNIDINLSNREAELLKSMLYGDTRNLSEDIEEMFNNIGISHITAVSGSNLNILLMLISFVIYRLKNKRKIYYIIQIVIILIFCVLSGMELSITRAAIMSIIVIICKYRNIKLSIEKVLIITLYIMTVLNPYRIFNIGLVFSFLAIVGLVYFYRIIYNFLESKIKWNIKNKVLIKALCFVSNIISVTLSVNILVLPLSIYYFNKFSLIFVLSNLIISPLSVSINVLGIISILLCKIPIISKVLLFILKILLILVINISKMLDNINMGINVQSIPKIILVCYYIYFLIICLKLKGRKKYIKNYYERINKKLKYTLLILIAFWIIYINFFNNYIYFFNVGQGEMAIVKSKDTVVMIDSGSITNNTSYIFKSYMSKENISKIDALVISHFHSDHINGIIEISKICDIEYLIYAYPYDLKSNEYVSLLNEIKDKNIKHIIVKAEDNIKINDIELNIVYPKDNYITVSNDLEENENANSLVVNVNIKDKNYLFMGDSVKQSEEKIIENLKKQNINKIEILKVGHHGSKTSTSDKFIQYTLPKYAIISSKKKVYNHPSKDTVNTLNKYSITTYITEKVGGIKYII